MQLSAAVRKASVLIVADPGRIRLRSAAATTLSLLLALIAMLAFTRVSGQPVTVAMLGAVVAMQASAAVKDRNQRSRYITTVLLFFPSLGAMALAAFLGPHGKIADVGFIAVLFCSGVGPAVRSTRKCTGDGRIHLLFLRAVPAGLAWIRSRCWRSLSLSGSPPRCCADAIFPDRPRVEARRLLSALRRASTSVLEVATQPGVSRIDVVRRRLDRLGVTALIIDDWLDRHEAAKSLSITSKDLALRVFEAQICWSRLASLLWSLDPNQPWPDGLRDAVSALRICLHQRSHR